MLELQKRIRLLKLKYKILTSNKSIPNDSIQLSIINIALLNQYDGRTEARFATRKGCVYLCNKMVYLNSIEDNIPITSRVSLIMLEIESTREEPYFYIGLVDVPKYIRSELNNYRCPQVSNYNKTWWFSYE